VGKEKRAAERQKSASDDFHITLVGALDDFDVGGDDLRGRDRWMGNAVDGSSADADVVDALEHDQVGDTRRRKHVPVESSKRRFADEGADEAVASDPGIDYAIRRCSATLVQPAGKNIGPAAAFARVAGAAVGDRVPQG